MKQKRKLLVAAVIFFILGLVVGGAWLWFNSVTKKIFVERPKTANSAPLNSIQQSINDKKPINILLVGYGGGNHEGTYLTDSIIAVHIDPKTQKVFLISIPRDIWVEIPTEGSKGSYTKINAAYGIGLDDEGYPNKQAQFTGSDGGGRLIEYIVGQILGIQLDYFVGLDFSGFTNTIDTLGGVTINVEKTFDDYAYPIEGKEDDPCGHSEGEIASMSAEMASASATLSDVDAFPCRYEHLHFNKGTQEMNGTTALKYVRSRHSLQDGTDFGRAQRQRNLIVAVKERVLSTSFIPKIVPFITSLGDDLRTDLSLDDVKTLVQNMQTLSKYQIVSLALTDENYLELAESADKQSILQSKDGLDNWSNVHQWLQDEFAGKPKPTPTGTQKE